MHFASRSIIFLTYLSSLLLLAVLCTINDVTSALRSDEQLNQQFELQQQQQQQTLSTRRRLRNNSSKKLQQFQQQQQQQQQQRKVEDTENSNEDDDRDDNNDEVLEEATEEGKVLALQHQHQHKHEQQQQQQHNKRIEYMLDSLVVNSAEESSSLNGVPPYDIFTCCNLAFGSMACRMACENLNLAQQGTMDNSGRSFQLDLKKNCPSMQMDFWSCMNRTLEAISRGSQWPGRRCCNLGLSPRCRNACATLSASDELLLRACRRSDEQNLFACFRRQEAGEQCCSTARDPNCLQACNDVFEPQALDWKRRNSLGILNEKCGKRNSDVINCVRNVTDIITQADAHKLLPCCEYSQSGKCRNRCRTLLNTTADDIMDLVIGELEKADCGIPLPHLPLWQCFLTIERKRYVPSAAAAAASVAAASSPAASKQRDDRLSQINEIGIDAAKLHCCEKALTQKCRRLCAQTFSTAWTTLNAQFERECRMLPEELRLRQCVDDVDEPSTLGCDGLSYCTNFNNRPTELFRSCTPETDAAARSDLKLWQHRGYVSLPGVDLPIKNMSRCAPEKWKAIACALQIKPSTRLGHYNHICREDCFEILSECMDWTRMNSTLNAEAICARFHPSEQGEELPCISMRPYLEESDAPKETGGHHSLTSLCKGHRCNASDVCVPRRRADDQLQQQQLPYQCVPGCSLGEGSSYWVPFGAFVRIPITNGPNGRNRLGGDAATTTNGAMVSFKVCRCGTRGRVEHCQPLPSYSYEHCVGGYQHGRTFMVECNVCSCYAGETTCTKKQCRLPGFIDTAYTSLPCNCPTHYVPVCGSNGNTYHSACIAKCLGLQDSEIEYGACRAWNPCQQGTHKCAAGQQCVVQRKVCLSTMQRPCLQYKCVDQISECRERTLSTGLIGTPEANAVCDTTGRTHRSVCDLLNARATIAHWGACQALCAHEKAGPVCGINGVTYSSECAAWANYILVDYHGVCREVGLLTHDMGHRCRTVTCPRPLSRYCPLVTPPGACCPICGGALRIIYSRKQIDRALYALRGQFKDLLTLQNVLAALDALIDLKECQLTGFLSMEVGMFVGVVPRVSGIPTRIQIEACVREAEKLSTLIVSQSHLVTSNLVLSGLTTSYMINPSAESSACRPQVAMISLLGSITALILLLVRLQIT